MNIQSSDPNVPRKEKAVVFWSGGKDSAMALYKAQKSANLEIVGLVTTVISGKGKTSVHEIAEGALERQAKLTGLPLRKMFVEANPANPDYELELLHVYRELVEEGISTVIYGDIFLEDIRTYREELLRKAGLKSLFPLWQINTTQYMEGFIHSGFKAIICCVNSALLGRTYLNRELVPSFLNDLPPNVDPAGENGEFHTFCYDGPIFKSAVPFTIGGTYTSIAELKLGEQTVINQVEHIEVL